MDSINKFDKSNLSEIRKIIDNKLSSIESEYNISLKLGNIKYSETHFTSNIECSLVRDGQVIEKIVSDFKKYANYSFSPFKFSLGFEFDTKLGRHKVIGYKPKNRKYPIIAEHLETGRRYKFATHSINNKYEASK